MAQVCDKASVLRTIGLIAAAINDQKDYLTELDAKIGDADHGINLSRGFTAVQAKLAAAEGQSIGAILKMVGMTLVSTVGGASGPLYGTAFIEAGNRAGAQETLSASEAAGLFQAALAGIIKRGHAAVGDKTMVDALTPVVEFLTSLPEDTALKWPDILSQAADAAHRGMESTGPLQALKGRASFLKERSVGHLDPGAVSCYLMIKTMADAAKNGG